MADPTQFLMNVTIILVFTKIGGMISKRLGMPYVLGQVLTGIFLGPSVFGLLKTDIFLDEVGQIGVILLMFLAGLETDMKQMKKVGARSFWVAIGGVVVPLVVGTAFVYAFRHNFREALFVGTMLTATSVSITAQTLMEMGKLRSMEGNVILGAAVIDDILGVILLAIVSGMGSGSSLLPLFGRIIGFFVLAMLFGQFFVPFVVRQYRRYDIREGRVTLALGCCLLFAWLGEHMGVAAIIGAYLMGIFFGKTRIQKLITERIEVLAYTFFVPIFFITIGAVADLRKIETSSLGFLGILVLLAILTKIFGCMFGAMACKCPMKSSLIIGIGMIARGEVGLIVASLGMRQGIIEGDIFSGTILIVLISTVVTPLLLTVAMRSTGMLADSESASNQNLPTAGNAE